MTDEEKIVLEKVKQAMIAAGYRFERSEDGLREVIIRPDGSIAILATRHKRDITS